MLSNFDNKADKRGPEKDKNILYNSSIAKHFLQQMINTKNNSP